MVLVFWDLETSVDNTEAQQEGGCAQVFSSWFPCLLTIAMWACGSSKNASVECAPHELT
jgi:hypothetical protein